MCVLYGFAALAQHNDLVRRQTEHAGRMASHDPAGAWPQMQAGGCLDEAGLGQIITSCTPTATAFQTEIL